MASAKIVLVDHFQSTDPKLIKNENVVHIIDHHTVNTQWKDIMKHLEETKYTINPKTRSCATLILHQINEDLKKPEMKKVEKNYEYGYNGVFELLLAPMLTDNDNDVIFSDENKTKDVQDKQMYVYLLKKLPIGPPFSIKTSFTSLEKNEDLLQKLKDYKIELKRLESDIEGFGKSEALCRKDMKKVWNAEYPNVRVCVPQLMILSAVGWIIF